MLQHCFGKLLVHVLKAVPVLLLEMQLFREVVEERPDTAVGKGNIVAVVLFLGEWNSHHALIFQQLHHIGGQICSLRGYAWPADPQAFGLLMWPAQASGQSAGRRLRYPLARSIGRLFDRDWQAVADDDEAGVQG